MRQISDQERRAELLFRFDHIIRKNYPDIKLPDFNEHSDVNLMQRVYDRIVTRIAILEAASGYKMYLLAFVMAVELVSIKLFGLEKMKGFTLSQYKSISNYQRLLVELGEKNYMTLADAWPVEVRIGGTVLINAVFFVLGKYVFEHLGDQASQLLGGIMGGGGGSGGGRQIRDSDIQESQEGGGGGLQDIIGGGGGGDMMGGLLNGLMGMMGGGDGGGFQDILKNFMGGGGKRRKEEGLSEDGTMKPPGKRRRRRQG